MNKKLIILIIVILLLAAGGVFWWWKYYETPVEKWSTAKWSGPEDYVVKETPEGKIVGNKKAGLTFKVPEGWKVKGGGIEDYYGSVMLYTPDAIFKKWWVEKGCKITPDVIYIKTSINTLEKDKEINAEIGGKSISRKEFAVIKIDKFNALKSLAEVEELNSYWLVVDVPITEKLYKFVLNASLTDKDQCTRDFEKFLESVSIKKFSPF